ncbi:hypothetical protein A7A76_13090 [Lysobacter enzymogenes]|nr:hypothetical protein [Lysobacter enzymogenes]
MLNAVQAYMPVLSTQIGDGDYTVVTFADGLARAYLYHSQEATHPLNGGYPLEADERFCQTP